MLDMIGSTPILSSHAVIDPLGDDPANEMTQMRRQQVRAFRIHLALTAAGRRSARPRVTSEEYETPAPAGGASGHLVRGSSPSGSIPRCRRKYRVERDHVEHVLVVEAAFIVGLFFPDRPPLFR